MLVDQLLDQKQLRAWSLSTEREHLLRFKVCKRYLDTTAQGPGIQADLTKRLLSCVSLLPVKYPFRARGRIVEDPGRGELNFKPQLVRTKTIWNAKDPAQPNVYLTSSRFGFLPPVAKRSACLGPEHIHG